MPLGHAIGRAVFLELGVIPAVAMLFNDPELIARKNAHLTIEMTSETPLGILSHSNETRLNHDQLFCVVCNAGVAYVATFVYCLQELKVS